MARNKLMTAGVTALFLVVLAGCSGSDKGDDSALQSAKDARDTALAAQEQAEIERDAALLAQSTAETERDDAIGERDAAMTARSNAEAGHEIGGRFAGCGSGERLVGYQHDCRPSG